MSADFEVKEFYPNPASEVFEALVSPTQLESYFVNKSSGPLVAGQHAEWCFNAYDKELLHVLELKPNEYLLLEWSAKEVGYPTRVSIHLSPEAEGTRLSLCESGWRDEPASQGFALLHAAAWQQLLSYLKAWLMHGVSLKTSPPN